MSVGTIVTIVLLMSVLVLGIFLVQKVFSSSTNAIDSVDAKLQDQINSMFGDEGKPVVIYPTEKYISLKKGDNAGFAFSIMNEENTPGVFSYAVSFNSKSDDCQMTSAQAESLIKLGKTGTNINLGSGNKMDDAVFVRYDIPETAPLCLMRYALDVKKDGVLYGQTYFIDVEIVA